MRNTYIIEKIQFVENRLHFSLNEDAKEKQFLPAGQVLTDSDDFSFIYLIEEENKYSYLKIPQTIWPSLVELLKTEQDPYLQVSNQLIELSNFNEELRTLLFNIEGNDNYGADFVNAVESVFEPLLTNEQE